MDGDSRRHRRLGVALEMRVRGTDCQGRPFDVATSSDDVSRGGCSFQTSYDLEVGAELELEIARRPVAGRPPSVFVTTGAVLRVTESEPFQYQVSVRFTGPQFPTFSSETTTT